MSMTERCTKTIHHLSRIQGQIEGLKKAIETEESCEKIAQLSTSILRSFDTARTNIIEGYIVEELFEGKEIPSEKAENLSRILSLYKA